MRPSEVHAAWTPAVDRASVSTALRRFVRFSVTKFFVPFNFLFAANTSRFSYRTYFTINGRGLSPWGLPTRWLRSMSFRSSVTPSDFLQSSITAVVDSLCSSLIPCNRRQFRRLYCSRSSSWFVNTTLACSSFRTLAFDVVTAGFVSDMSIEHALNISSLISVNFPMSLSM